MKKNIFIFLLFAAFSIVSVGGFAQDAVFNLNLQKVSLAKVFEEIEKNSDYSIVFLSKEVNLTEITDVQVQGQKVNVILDKVLKPQGLLYEIKGKHIIIYKKDVKPAANVASTQNKSVTGTVSDAGGEPLSDVTVSVKGTNTGVVSSATGSFAIDVVDGKSVLVFAYMGYLTQEITVGNRSVINVKLEEDSRELEEIVVVGYGTARKSTLTGSVASVKSEKLTVAPVTNITATLGGQLPGLITKQTNGWPGDDNASLTIRGAGSPLVIVDGVETKFENLDPSQVESVTILKDGSASIYGARAGNGVILVTTKRGIESKPVITLNASMTMQGSTRIFPASSSGQRAEYANEVHRNNGLPEAQIPYTDEEVRKFYDGTDPNYPNGDWFGATIRNWAPQQNHNLSIRGGSDKIKYYAYLGYNNQETIIKHDGGNFTRYNLQSNVDAKVTDRLTASVDVALMHRRSYFTADNSSNHELMWASIYESDPRFPVSLPDPDKMAYNGHLTCNPVFYSSTKLGGYIDNQTISLKGSGALAYDFKYVKGLKAKMMISYNYDISPYKQMYRAREFYTYNHDSKAYTVASQSLSPTSVSRSSSMSTTMTQQYSLAYNNVFAKIHDVSAIVVLEAISSANSGLSAARTGFSTTAIEEFPAGDRTTATNDSWSGEMGRLSWISRVNYTLLSRYMLEAILRADASARFAPENRWGYFPSVSLGWIISQEPFMKDFSAVDNLKLRLSEGQSGYDNIGNFDYLNTYGIDKQYRLGDEVLTGLYQTRVANPGFSWETMTIYNAGLDFSFFDRKIYGTGEVFYRLRDGILGTRNNSLPSTFGQTLPTENLNSQDTRGFEVMLGTAGSIGDFQYDVSGNISWSRSKWIKRDEPEYENPDQKRISSRSGRWTDLRYGYVSDGLFTSQAEIDALPYYYADLNDNSRIRPGDIKYKNLNGDNKLDWRDQTVIGSGATPNWMYGINTMFRYKNFDLSMLFQGAFGYTTRITLDPRLTSYAFEHRWTEQNNDPNAIVPRQGSQALNGSTSDFNIRNTSYIRLKNIALGYDFPKTLLQKAGISKARIYVAGSNIFTLSSISEFGVDPEVPEGRTMYYPQQRTLSVGINLSF